MKLELGKRYIRRDGQVTGPLTANTTTLIREYPYRDPTHHESYSETGDYYTDNDDLDDEDLVSEYTEQPSELEQLRTRVKELEAHVHDSTRQILEYSQETDRQRALVRGLETQLRDARHDCIEMEEGREHWHEVAQERLAILEHYKDKVKKLEAQIAELTKPKLVKQTWQNIYADGAGNGLPSRAAVLGARNYGEYGAHLGVLRRDTYRHPDGREEVRCELEPVSKEAEE